MTWHPCGYYSHFDCPTGEAPKWTVEFENLDAASCTQAPATECPKCGQPVEPDRTKPIVIARLSRK
jgi:hypothetical protein